MVNKILVCTSTFAETGNEPLEILAKNHFEVIMNPYRRTMTKDEVIQLGDECIGIISGSEPLDSRVLNALRNLRCISRVGIGLDNIDHQFAEKRRIVIKNTPNAPTRAVAELTVGLIFDLLRGISAHDREVRNGTWNKKIGGLIQNRDIGIIGLGRIGKAVAVLLTSLGAKVSATDIYPDREWASEYSVILKEFPELLKTGDVLTVHIPFFKGTAALIGENEFRLMKKGSFLLNLSRGGIVDENALYNSLKSHHLAGAAIDTFEVEPYNGPLTRLDNVVLTPHMGSFTAASRSAMEVEAVRNLVEVLKCSKDTI